MSIQKILVIRFRRVGDATLAAALCSTLRKSFPEAQIHYVLNENIAPLFEHHPAIDKIITFSDEEMHKICRYVGKVKRIMKEGNYDMIVDTRSTIKTLFFSLFSLKTKYRVGRQKAYNWIIQNYRTDNRYKGGKDNVELVLSLLDPLTEKFPIEKDPVFKLYYTENEKESFRKYMVSKGIDFSKPVIVASVGARLNHKIWAAEKMKGVLLRILNKYDVQVIFNYSGEKEKLYAEAMHKELNFHKRVFVNIEAKSLRELVVLFANSDFFFGNEGGPRHISQALEIPSFAIFSPTCDLGHWLVNQSEKYQGIEARDINSGIANDKQISNDDKFALVDVESVWERVDYMLLANNMKTNID